MSDKSRIGFAVWVVVSLVVMFTVLLWQSSTGAGLNIFDASLSLPALLALAPLLLKKRLLNKDLLFSLGLLSLYLLFGLLSLLWADSPDTSKAVRGALQALAVFVFFSYLQLSGHEALLRRGLMAACIASAAICFWHMLIFYGVFGEPFSAVLYQGVPEGELAALGADPMNAMLATLMITPQAAMLVGLLIAEKDRIFRVIGFIALLALIAYLIALERRTAQAALFAMALVCLVLYRNRFWLSVLGALVVLGVVVLVLFPETILSRGFSWRPEIWMATLERIKDAPFFGHGMTNNVVPVVVSDETGRVLGEFRHPHNMALSVTYNLGLVGLVLWALLWLPGLLNKMFRSFDSERDAFIILPMVAGAAALVFDGGAALSPLHHYWFCFWVPTLLLLSQPGTGTYLGELLKIDFKRSSLSQSNAS
jgi:O-antigen ligase